MVDTNLRGKHWKESANYGQILILTEKLDYHEGEQINGQVHLEITEKFPGNTLFLKIRGIEVVHFVESSSNMATSDDSTLQTEKSNLLNFYLPLYKWESSEGIAPGQYSFPFSFKLPDKLPNSFFQKINRALATVYYYLEPKLQPFNSKTYPLKFKRKFTISHPPKSVPDEEAKSVKNLTKCCFNQGQNVISCKFEKDSYIPGEEAKLYLSIDNSQSQVACSSALLILRQRLELSTRNQRKNFVFDVVVRELNGIPARQVRETNFTSLQLPPKQAGDYSQLKHNPDLKHILLKESSYGNTIPASTSGQLITSRFNLQISVQFGTWGLEDNILIVPCNMQMPPYELTYQKLNTSIWDPDVKNVANLLLLSQYDMRKTGIEELKENNDHNNSNDPGGLNIESAPFEKRRSLDHITMTTSQTIKLPKNTFKD